MTDGDHEVHIASDPTDLDKVGFRARRQGYEVRDCFSIRKPDGAPDEVGLLVRKEPGSTVAETFIRGGGRCARYRRGTDAHR